jgi:hypothetical protein
MFCSILLLAIIYLSLVSVKCKVQLRTCVGLISYVLGFTVGVARKGSYRGLRTLEDWLFKGIQWTLEIRPA